MRVHADRLSYKKKPGSKAVGGIKYRFTEPESIKELSTEQIAKELTKGKTIQPGITPFSERNRKKGKKGTCDDDFEGQQAFLTDIDNKRADIPHESPQTALEKLKSHGITPAFMYPTFSSTDRLEKFRICVVCDEEITDRAERDAIQGAFIRCFPQSDPACLNADRIFFGTDKGLYEGIGAMDAVFSKADLLAFAEKFPEVAKPEEKKQKFGETIPTGFRHGTLLSFAVKVLTKYGITDKAYELYQQRCEQCEEPKPDSEIQSIWKDACAYYEKNVRANPGYIDPADYAFADDLEPKDYSDIGQAKVFAENYKDRVRYCTAVGWLAYDGKRWLENELRARAFLQDLTDRQLMQAKAMVRKAQDAENTAAESDSEADKESAKDELDHAKNFRAFVLKYRNGNRIAHTLTQAQAMLEIDVTELDADPLGLNTPGGMVSLATAEIRANSPEDFCTKMTAVAPSHEGAEIWGAFLEKITGGDTELRAYLQQCSGMDLVGKVYTENLELHHGSGGNGKSTYNNARAFTLGDYTGYLSSEVLTMNCRKNKSPEFAELRGKRFVIAAELEEGQRLDTAVLKKLTSVDPIQAEKKYEKPFSFNPSHSTVLYTNHLPKVGTSDSGTWDRIIVVPFHTRIRGTDEDIKNYGDYLFQHCGGAILSWMIEGARQFIANGFSIRPSKAVLDAIEEYRQANDWLHNFLDECCEMNSGKRVMSADLYREYRDYATRMGDYIRNSNDFKSAMIGAGYQYKRTNRGVTVIGVAVKPFTEFSDYVPPLTGAS